MKKIASLLIVCIVFSLLCVVAMADKTDDDIFNGTRFRDGVAADPWVTYHNGYYYATRTGSGRVPVYKSKTIEGLYAIATESNIAYKAYYESTVYDSSVTEYFGSGATINGTWSPELHYFTEEDFPGYSGAYMYLALRKTGNDSSAIRMVVLKSPTGDLHPGDDSTGVGYSHPITGELYKSQPLLDAATGEDFKNWGCGQTILRIKEGEYKGIYTMWVDEYGRGTSDFYQIIRIAKLKNPWTVEGEVGTITTPTQDWEYHGSGLGGDGVYRPKVVEGATPVYGKNGEIFLIYSGSGYWTDYYALGQLTWTGGNPLESSSWVKLSTDKNPVFHSESSSYLRGAGHASFITDKNGNGFAVFHAYPVTNGVVGDSRIAYIEPYYIDYEESNGTSYGVVHIGVNDNRMPASWQTTSVKVNSSGNVLSKPAASVSYTDGANQLLMQDSLADGYAIYRATEGEDYYTYLTTTTDSVYDDTDVTEGETYSYHIYSYREEEISPDCAEVEVEVPLDVAEPSISETVTPKGKIGIKVTASGDCDILTVYRSDTQDGVYEEIESSDYGFSTGFSFVFNDTTAEDGATYYYKARAQKDGWLSDYSAVVAITYDGVPAPTISSSNKTCTEATLNFSGDVEYDSFNIYRGSMISDLELYATTTETSYTVTDMVLGQAYVYQVVGIKNGIVSDGSAYHSITVDHFVHEVAAKAATCTEDGNESYSYCLKCGESIVKKVVIPTTGHSYKVTEAEIPATTENAGKTAVETCSTCGDVQGGVEIPQLTASNGDLDGDNNVTLKDALLSLSLSEYNQEADLNCDGSFTLTDIILLLKKILNG